MRATIGSTCEKNVLLSVVGLRGWPGLAPVMAPSETFMRNGFLWINEDDTRTHLEDLWSFPPPKRS